MLIVYECQTKYDVMHTKQVLFSIQSGNDRNLRVHVNLRPANYSSNYAVYVFGLKNYSLAVFSPLRSGHSLSIWLLLFFFCAACDGRTAL
jgi:hypothetical protein